MGKITAQLKNAPESGGRSPQSHERPQDGHETVRISRHARKRAKGRKQQRLRPYICKASPSAGIIQIRLSVESVSAFLSAKLPKLPISRIQLSKLSSILL
jgi:hypothetical protein